MTTRRSPIRHQLSTLFLLLFLALPAQAQETGDVLIQGGTMLTVTNGTLENTDVLVRDGIIAEIGEGLSAPGGVEVIDASGMYVMPGIIDAH
jgi:imidazolonepropionase-like amidohydrolase